MKTESFYEELPAFDHFYKVTDSSVFHDAPASWYVVIADVEGSTVAIREGRYRDVNMVGSACITAVLNTFKRKAIPFVFGGDGATLLLPPEALESCNAALLATKDLALATYRFNLRIGIVPISLIQSHGGSIQVAKYQVAKDNFLAMFQGGGISMAEKWVKGQGPEGENFRLESTDSKNKAPLDGLSCRWQPLKSSHGKMLSILISARGDSDEKQQVYKEFLIRLEKILGNMSLQMNPVKAATLEIETVWGSTLKETRLKDLPAWKFPFSFLAKFLEISFARFLFVTNKSVGSFSPSGYKQEMSQNTDFRKFDDMLRMVIDCSELQIREIRYYLENERSKDRLFYGLHISDQALMTCLVFAASQNQHIHFIDGSDGGYAMAAVELKRQLASNLVTSK